MELYGGDGSFWKPDHDAHFKNVYWTEAGREVFQKNLSSSLLLQSGSGVGGSGSGF